MPELGDDDTARVMLAREQPPRRERPRGVAQARWAPALAHDLVEHEAERRVAEAGEPPPRIRFVAAPHGTEPALRTWGTGRAGRLPERRHRLRDAVGDGVPPRTGEHAASSGLRSLR